MDVQRSTYAAEAMARAMAGEAPLFGTVDCALRVYNPNTGTCQDFNDLQRSLIGRGQNWWFHNMASDIPTYETLRRSPSGDPETDEFVTVNSGTGEVLLDAYATVANQPNVISIPAGLWRFYMHHYVSNATGDTTFVYRVYRRTALGVETELFNVTTDPIDALVPTQIITDYIQVDDIDFDATDRLVIKLYGQTTAVPNIDAHFIYEGTTRASWVASPIGILGDVLPDNAAGLLVNDGVGNLAWTLTPVLTSVTATNGYFDHIYERTGAHNILVEDDLVLNYASASRLVATDAGKALASVADLTAWVAGTANRVSVANDGDGTITVSLPNAVSGLTSIAATTGYFDHIGEQTGAHTVTFDNKCTIIGTTTDGAGSLEVLRTPTMAAASDRCCSAQISADANSGTSLNYVDVFGARLTVVTKAGSALTSSDRGYNALIGKFQMTGDGTLNDAACIATRGNVYGGTLSTLYLADLRPPADNGTGVITDCYGCYVASLTSSGFITTGWGVYQAGASDLNHFAGLIRAVGGVKVDHIAEYTGAHTIVMDNNVTMTAAKDIIAGSTNCDIGTTAAPFGNICGTNYYGPKTRITPEGGLAIKVTNKTGGNSVQGQIVIASTSVDNAVETASANDTMPIGVIYNAGISDGQEVWVVVSGIADVLIDAGGCSNGQWLGTGATAGSADGDATPGVVVQHMQEIGHALEDRVGAGLAKAVLHFN